MNRVLARVNRFLRLMHKELGVPEEAQKKLNLLTESLRRAEDIQPIRELLQSAFDIDESLVPLSGAPLAVTEDETREYRKRFDDLTGEDLGVPIRWEKGAPDGALLGTATLSRRKQPFTLLLRSFRGHLMVRCVSPVGRLDSGYDVERIAGITSRLAVQVSAIYDDRFETYNLAVEREVLLAKNPSSDRERVSGLVKAVVQAADVLEASLLERDEPMETFRKDLKQEAENAS